MSIAGVLCWCVAGLCAGTGLRSLRRPGNADSPRQFARALAPTQLAAALMLAAGGIVALAGSPRTGLLVFVCILGAVGTLAAGSWQGGRYVTRQAEATLSGPRACGGGCATCTLSCAD